MRPLAKASLVTAAMLAALVVAGCATLGPEKSACALGDGERAVTVSLTSADCSEVQAAFVAAQKARQAAAAQAAEAERQRGVQKYRAEVAARMREDERKGFRATRVFRVFKDS